MTSSHDSLPSHSGTPKIVVLGTAAALLLPGACSGPDGSQHKDTTDPDAEATALAEARAAAANTIAVRFGGKVLKLYDARKPPPPGVRLRGPGPNFTEVDVTVALRNNPAAAAALARYKGSNAIEWFPPKIGADVEIDVTPSNPYGQAVAGDTAAIATDASTGAQSVAAHLYPSTGYPEDTVADLYIEQDVDNTVDGTTAIGVTVIGTMVLRDGQWLPSDQQPLIPSHIRHQ